MRITLLAAVNVIILLAIMSETSAAGAKNPIGKNAKQIELLLGARFNGFHNVACGGFHMHFKNTWANRLIEIEAILVNNKCLGIYVVADPNQNLFGNGGIDRNVANACLDICGGQQAWVEIAKIGNGEELHLKHKLLNYDAYWDCWTNTKIEIWDEGGRLKAELALPVNAPPANPALPANPAPPANNRSPFTE